MVGHTAKFGVTFTTNRRPRPSFRHPSPLATATSLTARGPTTSRYRRHRAKTGRRVRPVYTALLCAGRRALRVLGTRRLLVRLSPGRRPYFCIWLRRQHRLPARRALVRVRGRYRTHVRRAEWRVDKCGIYCTAWLSPLRPVIRLCSGVSIPLLGRHALYSFGGCILSRDTLLERMLSAAHQGLLRRAGIPGEIGLCGT